MKSYEGIPYWSLCKGAFLDGSEDVCLGDDDDDDEDEPQILINGSAQITVEIKNAGNTIARNVESTELLVGINATGNTSWKGTLLPGEIASYVYLAQPIDREIDITTEVTYPDVDPLSLTGSDIEGFSAGICSKKLRDVTFSSSGEYAHALPDLMISQPSEIKVYEDSTFDFLPILFNNGSDKIYDVEVELDFGSLTLIKGQKRLEIGDMTEGISPFDDDETCDTGDWNNVNISKSYRNTELVGPSKNNIIYELLDGVIRTYVDGVLTSHEDECENNILEITNDITLFSRYPAHVPPEPEDDEETTKEVSFKFYGNPFQEDLTFLSPSVDRQTFIPLTTIVTFEDFYGNQYIRKFTTDVIVIPSTATYTIVRQEKTDLGLSINYTNETNVGEPGQLNIELESKGFGPIEKYVLNLTIPQDVEVATNDSNWTGRIEAQILRVNDTLFVFSGEISREGNLSIDEKELIPLTLRGVKVGIFEIPYIITYDGKELSGALKLKVKGPELVTSKELSKSEVTEGEEIVVTVIVKNEGEGDAFDVVVSDGVPGTIPIVSGKNEITQDVLKPEEALVLKYTVKASSSANLGGTKTSWQDELGNTYTMDLETVSLTVSKPSTTEPPAITTPPTTIPTVTTTPAPAVGRIFPMEPIEEGERIELSTREGLGVLALTIVVLIIIFKLITIKVPAKEEE
jgi:uncharacterized repeat protein (TIGR01451 family)